jgi:hypothetical protein
MRLFGLAVVRSSVNTLLYRTLDFLRLLRSTIATQFTLEIRKVSAVLSRMARHRAVKRVLQFDSSAGANFGFGPLVLDPVISPSPRAIASRSASLFSAGLRSARVFRDSPA